MHSEVNFNLNMLNKGWNKFQQVSTISKNRLASVFVWHTAPWDPRWPQTSRLFHFLCLLSPLIKKKQKEKVLTTTSYLKLPYLAVLEQIWVWRFIKWKISQPNCINKLHECVVQVWITDRKNFNNNDPQFLSIEQLGESLASNALAEGG